MPLGKRCYFLRSSKCLHCNVLCLIQIKCVTNFKSYFDSSNRFNIQPIKNVPAIVVDNHEELQKLQETLSTLEATENSVEEKMTRVKGTLKKLSEELKLSWHSQVNEDLLLGKYTNLNKCLDFHVYPSICPSKAKSVKIYFLISMGIRVVDNLTFEIQKEVESVYMYLPMLLKGSETKIKAKTNKTKDWALVQKAILGIKD